MVCLKYFSYNLNLSEVFTVSSNSRTKTEAIFIELSYHDYIGYGQASFPPYMKEKRDDNLVFLSKIDLSGFQEPFNISEIHQYLDNIDTSCQPSKAAIDIAFYDLIGKLNSVPVYQLFNLRNDKKISTSFTIGMGNDDFVLNQLEKAKNYPILKIKLGSDNSLNKHIIQLIRKKSSQSIIVDFNQAFKNVDDALNIIDFLSVNNVLLVEQPLSVEMEENYLILKHKSNLPIFGDESIQDINDLKNKSELFHGINIKLMKSGGISKAYEMVQVAKEKNLKLMLGCMTESIVATTAAAHIASLFDFIDIDGHQLINNDPFKGISIKDGEVFLKDSFGLGVEKIS
jgi:L-alanine-DL-glutamate epimerase-like enolase superfamily enzyme